MKNNLKKLPVLILTAVMVFSLSTFAFADEEEVVPGDDVSELYDSIADDIIMEEEETPEESDLFVVLSPEWSGYTFELSYDHGGETVTAQTKADGTGKIDFGTVPTVNRYTISSVSGAPDMPEDITITTIPGSSIYEGGAVLVTLNLGEKWAGAVFSAYTSMDAYIRSFSADENGTAEIYFQEAGMFEIRAASSTDQAGVTFEDMEDGETRDETLIVNSKTGEPISGETDTDNEGTVLNEDEITEELEAEAEDEIAAEELETEEEEDNGDFTNTPTFMIIGTIFVAVMIVVIVIWLVLDRRKKKYAVYDDYDDDDYNDEYDDEDEYDGRDDENYDESEYDDSEEEDVQNDRRRDNGQKRNFGRNSGTDEPDDDNGYDGGNDGDDDWD